MRFVAPSRDAVDPRVFARPPLDAWSGFSALLTGPFWPSVAAIDSLRLQRGLGARVPRFVEQTPELLRDGLHYETRIARRGEISTRADNWHDLLNALVWMRWPALKAALNARQVEQIALVGDKRRTRVQCALTHFDEAGVVVMLRDPALLAAWDAHDWHGLFWRARDAWRDGSIEVAVFGHALLEHALRCDQLLVGKAIAVGAADDAIARVAHGIRHGALLNDPQELRPLPLSGIPGWHADNDAPSFYADAPCFRARREGRAAYPPAVETAPRPSTAISAGPAAPRS